MKTVQSLRQFQGLNLDEQVSFLYQHGTFVMAIRYYNYKVNLYMIDGNYLEVFFNHKQAKIDRIELLDFSSNRMKFYADQIKIPDLQPD